MCGGDRLGCVSDGYEHAFVDGLCVLANRIQREVGPLPVFGLAERRAVNAGALLDVREKLVQYVVQARF